MAVARSISAREISAAAKSTVAKVREQHKTLHQPNIVVGFVPPWWWIGIIIRKPEIGTIAEAEAVATELHRGIGAAVPSVKGSKPGVLIEGGITTIGFAPPTSIEVLHE